MSTRGFGLVELSISLLLSTMIMMLLVQQVIHIRRQYQQVETFIDESMGLAWASDLIRHSIRSAGFTPCLRLDHLTTAAHQNFSPIEVSNSPNASITIRRMDERVARVLEQRSTSVLRVEPIPFQLKKTVLIADCKHAEVHELEKIKSTSSGMILTLKAPLRFTYEAPVYVGEWVVETFFIKKSALYYKNARVDALARCIHDFDVKLSANQDKKLIQLRLTLDGGRVGVLDTMVRAS